MDLDTSFYLTVSSSADSEFFPDNAVSHFKNKTPSLIDLNEKWEVALVEMSCPFNFHNITNSDVYFTIIPINKSKSHRRVDISMHPGHYRNPDIFIKALNASIKSSGYSYIMKNVRFQYDEITQRVRVRKKGDISLKLSPKLKRMLGFHSSRDEIQDQARSDYVMDITDSLHHIMYVNTNIVEHRAFGRQLVPLIRILSIKGTGGDVTDVNTFPNLHYFRARRQIFDTVEINIRDSQGNFIPFNRGVSILTFHF